MQPPTILVDVTELAAFPNRTGIQRVVRAALRYWPTNHPVLPCRFDPGLKALVPLPPQAIALLTETDPVIRTMPTDVLKVELNRALAAGSSEAIDLTGPERIFVPELFFDAARAKFYRKLLADDPESAAFLVYDFIPWLRPDLLQVDRTDPLMPYVAVLLAARRLAFISKATQTAFAQRIRRHGQSEGAVLPLGADALLADGHLQRQSFRQDRWLFVALGSIDGRKNQDLMAVAFARLRASGLPVRLTIVGGVFANKRAQSQAAVVNAIAAADPDGIRHVSQASDTEVATLFAEARATLYLSDAEGFGLPPIEGLAAGIPAIIGGEVPSVTELPSRGWVCLPTLSVEDLVAIIEQVSDHDTALGLWAEAATLELPTWHGFGAAVAAWLQDRGPLSPPVTKGVHAMCA